jgi:hypothetical protein
VIVTARLAVASLALTLLAACDTSPRQSHNPVLASPVRSAADLSCSLPVRVGGTLGFVDFPSGRFRVDASAPVPEQNAGYLYANGARRWVKVFYAFAEYQLSPDGTQMATVERAEGSFSFPTEVVLIDLKSNKSRRIATLPAAIRVLGYLPDGIYVYGGSIFRIDPTTGKVTEIKPTPAEAVSNGLWFWVTPSAAWSSLIAGPNQGDRDSVKSIRLSDGSVTTWYTAPATRSVSILGFVSPDTPLVAEYNTEPYDRMTGVSFMLLTEPGNARALNFDPSINAWGVTDSFGVWLSSPDHLWLYDSAGLFSMTKVPADFKGIAGFCR